MLLLFLGEIIMLKETVFNALESNPIIAAVKDERFKEALESPSEVIFLLGGNLLTLARRINAAHEKGKFIFIHLDLAEGVGKDRAGVEFLARSGADGIISTKTGLIRIANEMGLTTVQRFFVYDSHGVGSINETLASSRPDIIEIMPGTVGKVIKSFSGRGTPLIAGGLIETKQEATEALSLGALAVSTGKNELWYM